MFFEFLIPKRPVSLQTRNKDNLRAWKFFVHTEASKTWKGMPHNSGKLHLTLVYLHDIDAPGDADNIIKPIQDALNTLVYADDSLISDVESHRRPRTGSFEIAKFPDLLVEGLLLGKEFVYVKVADAKSLEDYLL